MQIEAFEKLGLHVADLDEEKDQKYKKSECIRFYA